MIFSQIRGSGNLGKARGGLPVVAGFFLLLLCSIPSVECSPALKDPSPAEVNQAFGVPLFAEGSLWEEPAPDVASRLGLRPESLTSVESGYRFYPGARASILGVRPFSLFLQGVGGKAARLSVIYSNKGDVSVYATELDRRRATERSVAEMQITPQMMQAYQAAIRRDGDALRAKLSELFGPSIPARLGNVAGMDERGERWNWRGNAFLLSSPRNEYVALRILPASLVDDPTVERRSFLAAKEMLPRRVIRRPNGDVVLSDLPMVDQGAKGYCVPATYERVLRYYGLSADMNLLAMAGSTGAGGGTSMAKIAAAAYALVREAGGRIISGISGVRVTDVQSYIDKGEPLIWALDASDELNDRLDARMGARSRVSDAQSAGEWSKKVLPPLRVAARGLPRRDGHVCLIIGYNRTTREIAISDSWGPRFAERWITEEEAQAVTQGESTVIAW